MKIKKFITGILVTAVCIIAVPIGINAASSDTGTFSFSLKPKDYDYSKQVLNTLKAKKAGETATVIVTSCSIPKNSILNVRVVKHGTENSSEDNLYSSAVTITENKTYNPTYLTDVPINLGYKLRGHVTKDSSAGGSVEGSWSLN